ncbi:transglutaminase [Pilimelia anulata]|uniref:Transglutaminase n=1 Tax=Pilimelia anulata TaxID=53371 RepID=A0A8J3B8L2_9ACTN|nr:transglutaminase domain-containing protein [Pilimelia anulata]GGJ85447.1 transglutaminase [Pilimelia anulata]
MKPPRRLSVIAGVATLLGAAPLWSLFDTPAWAVQALIVVALITVASVLVGRLPGGRWLRVPVLLGALLLALTHLFPSGGDLLGLLPTGATLGNFAALVREAPAAVQGNAIPVPDLRPLLFLAATGVGLVAVAVDVLAVGARRPALAGLPLLVVYAVPVAIHTDSAPVAPFAVGATGFLWLLVADNLERVRRFGRRFRGDGSSVDAGEPSPLGASARRLGLVGVVLAVLLPLAVPEVSAGVLGPQGIGAPGGGRPGGGRPVDLFADLSGRLNQPQVQELVRLETNDPRPEYLRFAVADIVDERGFRAGGWSGTPIGTALGGNRRIPAPGRPAALPDPALGDPDGPVYEARVSVSRAFAMRMAPVYPRLAWTTLDNDWLLDPERETVYSSVESAADRRYRFGFARPELDARTLRRAGPLPPDDPARRWTEVPPLPRVQQLVAELTRGATTDYDRVERLRGYFDPANGFRYDLRTEPSTTGAAITDFLDRKVGFCQQYAAALAWLVRAAGIPARVAIGFTLGNDNRDGVRVLTNRNLHAWTEVYFPGVGWVLFESTPPAAVTGTLNPAYAPNAVDVDTDRPAPGASTTPTGAAEPAPTGAPSRGPGRDIDAGAPGAAAPVPAAADRWWLPPAVLLVVALLALPALYRRRLRRRRAAPATGAPAVTVGPAADAPAMVAEDGWRARAHAAWAELTDTLVDYGVPTPDNDTPRQRAARIGTDLALPAPMAEAVRGLAHAEERARYARSGTGADPAATAAALGAVRAACAERTGRGGRLAATLLPRSVLRRAAAALRAYGERAGATAAAWRATAERLTPRRATRG